MQTTKPDFLSLPTGYTLVKTGGRPKKEARDVAVFLAKFWRMQAHGDSATKAEKWIVDKWEEAGKEASKGISETAHVRAAIKRSRTRGLNFSLLMIDPGGERCTAVECERHPASPVPPVPKNGARSWHWVGGMTEAVEGRVKNSKVTVHQEVVSKSSVAEAVASLISSIS